MNLGISFMGTALATADPESSALRAPSMQFESTSAFPTAPARVSSRGPNIIYLGLATFAAGFAAILWRLYVFYSGGASGGLDSFFRSIQFWDFVLYFLSAIGVLLVGVGFIVELRDIARVRDPAPIPRIDRQRRGGLIVFAVGIGLIVVAYLADAALELYSYEQSGWGYPGWVGTSLEVAVGGGILIAAIGWFLQHQVRPANRVPVA